MRLDDDLVDYLLCKSPKFIEECRGIRERMDKGEYHTLEEVKAMFKEDSKRYGRARAKKRTTKHPKKG